MKTLLKLFVFASVIILIAISCQKILSNEGLSGTASGKEFNTAFVKNWYYGTFVKTSEWGGSAEKDKKLPDWGNGVVTTIEKQDAVVYPFIQAKSSFSIPGDKSLTASQCKKIADASLSKIVFIKTADNQIIVKEIDYIPDWQYLQSKQFNIGELKDINGKTNFTGRIVVKNWEGGIISTQILVDGEVIKIGRKVSNSSSANFSGGGNTTSVAGCTYTEYCIWQQDCTITIYGDGMITNECGEWYNTGECWTEENCPPPPPPPSDGGGGGDEEDLGTDVTVYKEFLIKKELTAQENWEIRGTADLSGRVFTNPSSNYFTSCISPISVWWCFQANCSWNLSPLYIQFTELSRTSGLTDPQTAAASFNTKIVYPNWPGGANTVYYQGAHTWNAAQDLP